MRDSSIPYDLKCALEFRALIARVEHLFIDIDINCPYGLQKVASFHQATFAPLSERVMELFLAAGFRRNGNCLYSMRCPDCSSCTPIRLKVSTFSPNRNQKRALKKNSDLTFEILPLGPNLENLELCDRFLAARYPKENNSARGYFKDFFLNNIVSSGQIQYRLGGKLIGTTIVDMGYNWLNAVYFYFDPEESKRSLGTYNILHLLEICTEWDIEYLYLGYLINEVPAMSYKKNFRPHDILREGEWKTNP
jgi:arginyl-tRNA--protein-N-Asp/Glu arginylyltransferase